MVKDGSDNAERVRMYAGLTLLVVAILVISTLVASSYFARDAGSGSADTGTGSAGAGVLDVGDGGGLADEGDGEDAGSAGITTLVEPSEGPADEPQGPLVEDEATGEMLIEAEDNLYVAPKGYDSNGMRRVTPGTLDWKYDTPEGEELSTPGLVDLNGDGTHEVVFASHGDAIYALSHKGSKKWVNTENIIEQADDGHFGWLDFEPPPIFSSVTPADIDGSSDPEILVGVEDGIVCLNADGSIHWKKGLTDGYYFSTPP